MQKICCLVMLVMISPSAFAVAVTTCLTKDLVCASSTYACPGSTRKTCPEGWTLSGSQCVRSGSTTGSDTTGNYTTTYTSCAAKETTCYTAGSASKSCFQCDPGSITQ